ncbi:tripartite tricarboxylate transporter TctB family protein [Defluviimonas sp. WL0075]|uniref:Tripartite tricarboxylate transporter TctB family protein n=1 Tax=Albidovulum sediminicola TaxID=2984331 RepID=A0ABT2Z6P5_9RHOB|nr:tripartite tricarboxylate transporter TctB family protein [Defluviimonas sp. WL0075]MCV2866710.1 tripartite tricarboxylate transporter TctB family protein [Defluviimonas sp. WL0075]
MSKQQINLVSGIGALFAAGLIFWLTKAMPDASAGFPRLIAIGFAICGAILSVRALRSGELAVSSGSSAGDEHRPGTTIVLLLLWLTLLYAASWAGFVLPGAIFLALASWLLLGRPTDRRELGRIAAYAAGMTLGLWIVFVKLLHVDVPGVLGF